MLIVRMWLGRVSCAVALICVVSCAFPDYRHVDDSMPAPTCDDGVLNGAESDQDCGDTCLPCEAGKRCFQASDCESVVCSLGICQPSDCNDKVRNGLETGVDCGGGGCKGCDNGAACKQSSDCTSLRCQSDVCVSAGCTDVILNGEETDVDCGGADCAPCAADEKCKLGPDCESRICRPSLTCAAASCSDSTQNQGESDVDCGGPGCAPCQLSQGCSEGTDCESALCQSGMCVPLNPAGQPLSQSSWTIETSEVATEMGTEQAIDGDVSTSWTSGKPQYAGMYVQLDLGQPRYFFKALLRVTAPPYENDFPARLDVYISNDGVFGEPVQSSVQGNQYTWFDFPSAQVGRYVRFELAQDGQRSWSIGDIALYN